MWAANSSSVIDLIWSSVSSALVNGALLVIDTVGTSSIVDSALAQFKLVHGAPGTGAVNALTEGTVTFANVPYQSASSYDAVASGPHTVTVEAAATPGAVIADTKAALTFKLAHDDISKYNAVQKLLYAGVIVCGIVIVLSGLAIWKPVQFQELTALFGGYDFARFVHFFAMAAIVGFLIVHILLALLVPKSLRAMVTGK